jgi:hypothetical protein
MPGDKTRSLRALDALNFCNAGVQTGLGPFMAIFYTATRHWSSGQIGVLLACQSLAGIAVQSFTGHLVDESHHKRTLTALAAGIVALGGNSNCDYSSKESLQPEEGWRRSIH